MHDTTPFRQYIRTVLKIEDDQLVDLVLKVNDVLSAPDWSVSMLEDITAAFRAAGVPEAPEPPEYVRH